MKYCGTIGFSNTTETSPGIWTETIVTRKYFGEVLRNSRRNQNSSGINDNVIISNEISIVADPYLLNNLYSVRFIEYMGVKWKVLNVDIQDHRLNISIGDVYNEAAN